MKKKIAAIVAIILALGIIYVYEDAKASSTASISEKWGSFLGNKSDSKTVKKKSASAASDIYAEGKEATISITEMKQAVYFYQLQGNENAEELAYEYMKESAALYAKAVSEGYAVTDEEVESYVAEIRATAESDELDETSRQQVNDVIAGFGGEENYWEYQVEVNHKLLVSQKYVDKLQEEFYADSSKGQEEWNDYFDNFKRNLVEEEHFEKKAEEINERK